MREIKSGKLFKRPGRYVEQIPKGLFRVSDAKTRVSALLLTVEVAAFFVHATDVTLSASIWTTGYGWAAESDFSDHAKLVAA